MELSHKREFFWPSEKEKFFIKEIVRSLKASAKIDVNESVLADIDYLLDKGIDIREINKYGLITSLKMLENELRKINLKERESIYNVDKLIKMAKTIFRRWRAKNLNNKALDAEITQRVCNKIINSVVKSDEGGLVSGGLISGELNKYYRDLSNVILEKFKTRQYDDSYDFQGLEQFFIKELTQNSLLKEQSKHGDKILELIRIQRTRTFLTLFKTKDLKEALLVQLEEDIQNNWIHIVQHRLYIQNISSLDFHCWELALIEVRKSGRFCTVRMDEFIKSSFRKIIGNWRKGDLPDIPQLEVHLRKYLVDYFIEKVPGVSELNKLITQRAIKDLVDQRNALLIPLIEEICFPEVKAQFLKEAISLEYSTPHSMKFIVLDMIERYRTSKGCVYNNEIREISHTLCEQLINADRKAEEIEPISSTEYRGRFFHSATLLNQNGNFEVELLGEKQKIFG